jgi:hypothetical protein
MRKDAMMIDGNASEVRISNWTMATATRPGERHVYPANSLSTARRSAPDAKP